MRKPDQIILRNDVEEYLYRWFIVRRSKAKHFAFNAYIHKFLMSDEQDPHDHPWWSVSFCLWGDVTEVVREDDGTQWERKIPWMLPVYRPDGFTHRLILQSKTCWTLFITGRNTREWGFYTKLGWIRHDKYSMYKRGEGHV